VETRDEALTAFDEAHGLFVAAYEHVPDEALSFLKPGDDYALGGLVAHARGVVEHYRMVLETLVASDFGETRAVDPPGFWETVGAEAKRGLEPAERERAFENLASQHRRFVATASGLAASDWERKADVFYGDATEVYATSPADVCGWLVAHYLEHLPHLDELLGDWRSAAGTGGPASPEP
jgi:hypothetical protein